MLIKQQKVKALEVINRTKMYNLSYISRSLWNKLNDCSRAYKTIREKEILSSEWLEKVDYDTDDDEVSIVMEEREDNVKVEDEVSSNMVIDEIIEMFKDDEKKLKYIKLMLFYMGLTNYLKQEEAETIREQDKKLMKEHPEIKEHMVDKKIAKLLGYNTYLSKEYKILKNDVRQLLRLEGYWNK